MKQFTLEKCLEINHINLKQLKIGLSEYSLKAYKQFEKMCAEWRQGERTAVSIYKKFDITAQTFYRWVKERNL